MNWRVSIFMPKTAALDFSTKRSSRSLQVSKL